MRHRTPFQYEDGIQKHGNDHSIGGSILSHAYGYGDGIREHRSNHSIGGFILSQENGYEDGIRIVAIIR